MKNEVKLSLPKAEKQSQLRASQAELTDLELDNVSGGLLKRLSPQPLPPDRGDIPAVYL